MPYGRVMAEVCAHLSATSLPLSEHTRLTPRPATAHTGQRTRNTTATVPTTERAIYIERTPLTVSLSDSRRVHIPAWRVSGVWTLHPFWPYCSRRTAQKSRLLCLLAVISRTFSARAASPSLDRKRSIHCTYGARPVS